MRFAVFAEDETDAVVLQTIIRKLLGNDRAHVPKKGFRGKGNLLKDIPLEILSYAIKGATHFVICQDSDGETPAQVKTRISNKLSRRSHNHLIYFVAVPVQELEAWLIADEEAIRKAIPSFVLKPQANPEMIPNPKEWLIRRSRINSARPLYAPATYNQKVALHLDLEKVAKKCPSFSELKEFVINSTVA